MLIFISLKKKIMPARQRTPEEIERAKQVARELMAQNEMKDQQRKVKNARITLIVLACLQAAVGLWEGFGPTESMLALGIDFAVGAIFLGLYFMSKTQPLPAFIAAMIVYAGIHILLIALDPSMMIRGLFLKIVIIILLANGIRSAHALPKPRTDMSDELLDEELDNL
jgi:uncharacterized membrane protein